MKKYIALALILGVALTGCSSKTEEVAEKTIAIEQQVLDGTELETVLETSDSNLESSTEINTGTVAENNEVSNKENTAKEEIIKNDKPVESGNISASTNTNTNTAPNTAPNTTQTPVPAPAKEETVSLSIDGLSNILGSTQVEFKEGDTVLSALLKATKENKIQMEYRGKGNSAYIEGIDNLYEFDKGPTSGWMYSVNGEFPSKSAGSYELKSGDIIRWRYTQDLGKDLGARS